MLFITHQIPRVLLQVDEVLSLDSYHHATRMTVVEEAVAEWGKKGGDDWGKRTSSNSRTDQGDGAVILEKVPRAVEEARSEATAKTKAKMEPGQRRSAANELECAA